jgi:DNA-directed RNA polymerase subunit RPC12/RpoP
VRNKLEDVALQLRIDVERRTTRGRACPRCGGKIIPSRRAVYQSTGDPNAVFPAWQCERCGYEELIARPVKAAPKHGAAAAVTKAATAPPKTASGVPNAGSRAAPAAPDHPPAARAVPALKDRKGRALPPDVNQMMDVMNLEKTGQ